MTLNCLYCKRYEECQVLKQHAQLNGDVEKQDALDRIIPWDGVKNGRCEQFEDVEVQNDRKV